MTGARARSRRSAAVVECLLLGAAAAGLVVIFLPAARRARERARRLDWVEDVRSRLDTSRTARGVRRALPETWLRLDMVEPELASWGNIGGCGVGGGGGGDVRWIGRRAPGGVEVESIFSHAAGEDLKTSKLNLKVSADIPGRFNVGVSVPYLHSERFEPVLANVLFIVDSWGDVNLLVSRKFGTLGATSANLTVGVPTAPYDLRHEGWVIPYDAQPGRGKWTCSLGAEQTMDRDRGPVIFGGSYNYNGGENDVGDYRADSVSSYYYFSYRAAALVHSLGANLTFALGKDKDSILGEIEDQGTALLSLQYGLELSVAPRLPLFLSVTGTVSEKRAESYTLALGVVTSF